jgi:hypothetical protein
MSDCLPFSHVNYFVFRNNFLQTNFRACCAAGGITTLLAVSPRCWRYHHAAGDITTLLVVSPRCWRYHHDIGGITTLLAVSPRCSLSSSTLTVTVSLQLDS